MTSRRTSVALTRPGHEAGARSATSTASLETRRLAERLRGDRHAVATETFQFLATQIPEIRSDSDLAAMTYASCVAAIEDGLSRLSSGLPADSADTPAAVLEHARYMAARGASVEEALRIYRLGHGYFWERWAGELEAAVTDPERLVAALRETAAFTFGYIDVISARVSAEMVRERKRRQRRMSAVREEAVAALLAGGLTDVERAERILGFALSGRSLAFLCWTDGDPAALDGAAAALAAAAGCERPLVLADGALGLAGWLRVGPGGLATPVVVSGVHVAVGDPGSGLEGFRASRDQAERARRIAQLARTSAPSFTCFEDIALVDLLSRDLPAARALVHAELGPLVAADERGERLRETLVAYLAGNGSHTAAAAALGIHRNTLRQRLAHAERLRGRPATRHAHELLAALLLVKTLGRAAHQCTSHTPAGGSAIPGAATRI